MQFPEIAGFNNDLISNRARHKRFNEPNANAFAAGSSSSLCLCGESPLRLIRLGYQRSPRQGSIVAVDNPTNSKSARFKVGLEFCRHWGRGLGRCGICRARRFCFSSLCVIQHYMPFATFRRSTPAGDRRTRPLPFAHPRPREILSSSVHSV
jgi:hypothetical protein